MAAAEIGLLEAKVRLAEAQRDPAAVLALLRELLARQLEERRLVGLIVTAGRATPAELDQVDARLAEVRARLARARSESPAAPLPDAVVEQIGKLPPEEQLKAVSAELKKRNPGFDGELRGPEGKPPKVENGAVVEVGLVTDEVTDISPVRAFRGLRVFHAGGLAPGKGQLADLLPLAGLPLTGLDCPNNPELTDLTPVKGLSLTRLNVSGTGVNSLDLVKGMPLTEVRFGNTPVTSLRPLAGRPLQLLACEESGVKTLKGLPAAKVRVLHCELRQLHDENLLPDEAELKRLGVEEVHVWGAFPEIDAAALRALGPRLKQVDGKPADEVLKGLDKD
jgi:hypothetical protein